MSKGLLFKILGKHARLRALLLCAMGAASLLSVRFLECGMLYVIAAYALLNAALGAWDYLADRRCGARGAAYFELIAAGIMALCGILCLVYARYLLKMLPLFFGAFLIACGIAYLAAGVCVGRLKPLIVLLALLIGLGGLALMVFSFGFGGLLALSRLFGVLLLICCADELLIACNKQQQ